MDGVRLLAFCAFLAAATPAATQAATWAATQADAGRALPSAQPGDDAAARRQALQDRVAKLIGEGKCQEASDAATAGGDALMAEQASEVCGAGKSQGSGGKSGGRGAGRSGGGGRRGGG